METIFKHQMGTADLQELSLPGGQRTSWREYGAATGEPLIFCNGWPGSSEQGMCLHALGERLGFRIIAPDRPGFGRSTPQPGRGLLDWPPMVAAIADHLNLQKFALMGISGGGPYVLATAWALGSRVRAVCLCCTAVPTHLPEARGGLHAGYRGLLKMNEIAPTGVRTALCALAWMMRIPIPTALLHLSLKWLLPKPDAAALSDRAMFDLFAPSYRAAMRAGGGALYEDGHPYTAPWPFAVEEIHVPVRMWHGAQDANFQIDLARRLAARLGSVTFFERDEGHYSIAFRCTEEMLRDLKSLL